MLIPNKHIFYLMFLEASVIILGNFLAPTKIQNDIAAQINIPIVEDLGKISWAANSYFKETE